MNSLLTDSVALSPAKSNRWAIAAAGVAIQMMLGTVYAWSVFKKPLVAAHGWSEVQVGFTFTLTIFFLGLSAALGGRFVDRAGTRRVASVAAVLFGAGTLLAGLADSIGSLPLLWLGYGVIAGIGNGLAYVTPVAVLVRWFPDRKGMITGMAVMGFGLGAAVMGQVAPLTLARWGADTTFYVAGAVFLVGLLLAARKLVNPPAGYEVAAANNSPAAAPAESMTFDQARRTPQFYILWGVLFLNVTAGIALLSNLSPMAQAQLKVSPETAGTIVAVASLFNGLGRLFWASLSEKIGRKRVFLLIFASQVPMFLLLPMIQDTALFATLCCYILLCYGGGFGTMPSFTADTFGPRNIGSIYGPILLAWGVAGAVGPMLMEWIKRASGNFQIALFVACGLLVLGFLLTWQYRPPRGKENIQ